MSINVERWSLFNLWKCPRDRIDYHGCTAIYVMGRHPYIELIYDRKLRDCYCKILHRCKHNCRGRL